MVELSVLGMIATLALLGGAAGVSVLRRRQLLGAWLAGHRAWGEHDYPRAEACFRRSLALSERRFGASHWRTSLHVSALAQALLLQNRVDDAAPFITRSLAIYEATATKPTPEMAIVLVRASLYEGVRGNATAAADLLERARLGATGSLAAKAAVERVFAGKALASGGRKEALEALSRIPDRVVGRQEVRDLTKLAADCAQAGELERAVVCLAHALAAVERRRARRQERAFYRGLLGEMHVRAGHDADGRDALARAIRDYERVVGRAHPALVPLLVTQAEAYARLGEAKAARAACERAIAMCMPDAASRAEPYRVSDDAAEPLAADLARARSLLRRLA